MDFGKNEGHYYKSLFALGERVENNSWNDNIEETNSNESDSDESVSKESCLLCLKTYQSPNILAIEEIRRANVC